MHVLTLFSKIDKLINDPFDAGYSVDVRSTSLIPIDNSMYGRLFWVKQPIVLSNP